MSKTSLALHNLRGFVILNVLVFHSFIAYIVSQPASPLPFDSPPYGWTANPIVDSHRWLGFDLICAFEFLCLMQLMFLLSGLFVWPSLRRKGAKTFLQDRLLRVGVPFVLGVSVLMPLAYYPVYRVTAVDPGWSAFWSHWTALPFWPGGPMWFLWFLLALNIAAAGALGRVPGPACGQRRRRSRPVLHRAGRRLGARLCARGRRLYPLAMGGIWAFRVPARTRGSIYSVLLRRRRRGSVWARARPAGIGRNAGAALGFLARRHSGIVRAVDRSHRADREGARCSAAGPANPRRSRRRAVRGKRLFRPVGGVLALCCRPIADLGRRLGQCLRDLSVPLCIRALDAIPAARRVLARYCQGRDRARG
ncbi:MAG: acyltransferase [Alphaproteobacteria bacterium]|nr:MAG: acyltransferase [Alphaproteobacteria bacterium]